MIVEIIQHIIVMNQFQNWLIIPRDCQSVVSAFVELPFIART